MTKNFWQRIREIAVLDDSIDPPESTVNSALDIFQPSPKSWRSFQLQPSFAGMVRRVSTAQKMVYELDDQRFVQIETTVDADGAKVAGFAAGIKDTKVMLLGGECVFEADILDGVFEFKSIPLGCYDMTFLSEGESLWIQELALGDNAST